MHPDTPYTPWPPDAPWHPLLASNAPDVHYTPAGPEPLHSLPAAQCTPDTPYTPYQLSNAPWYFFTLLAPEDIHFLSAPWHPLHPC